MSHFPSPARHGALQAEGTSGSAGLSRRAFGMIAGAALVPAAARAESALPVPASLRESAAAGLARREPLVLLVSLPGCPYCELVRRNYLLPMRGEGLNAWQIDVTDRHEGLLDFDGQRTSAAALAAKWKATFTPTVLFFDTRGTELAERIVGVASPDFYGGYLDSAVLAARRKIGG